MWDRWKPATCLYNMQLAQIRAALSSHQVSRCKSRTCASVLPLREGHWCFARNRSHPHGPLHMRSIVYCGSANKHMLACLTDLVVHGIEGRHVHSSAELSIDVDPSVAGSGTLHCTIDMDPRLCTPSWSPSALDVITAIHILQNL